MRGLSPIMPALNALGGMRVVVTPTAAAPTGCRAVFRRSLVARLLSGRTTDVEVVMEPACYPMGRDTLVVHPALEAQIRGAIPAPRTAFGSSPW